MTILLTGGSGTTGSRLAKLLQESSHPVLVASRSGLINDFPAVKFDWTDKSTFVNPFTHAQSQKSPITAVYLVAPDSSTGGPEPITKIVNSFINLAKEKGVRRFVLLSASPIEAGGEHMLGETHAYLRDLDVEWAVLRPTWFQENFLRPAQPIGNENAIYSAAGDGKVPFVSAEDIAAVAYHALTDDKSHDTDHLILGPELLSYGDVASIFSNVLGRKIVHKSLTEAELTDHWTSFGMPLFLAKVLAELDTAVAHGSEDRLNDTIESVTGKPPTTFEQFVRKNENWELWEPKN